MGGRWIFEVCCLSFGEAPPAAAQSNPPNQHITLMQNTIIFSTAIPSVLPASLTFQIHPKKEQSRTSMPPRSGKGGGKGRRGALQRDADQVPLCEMHREGCKLLTVRKEGANKGRRFWTCPRSRYVPLPSPLALQCAVNPNPTGEG